MIKDKTPKLTKAKKALEAYLKENNLDPMKDWTRDKVHGKKVTYLVNILNKERDKLAMVYPSRDLDNERKLLKLKEMKKMKKAQAKAEEKEAKKKVSKEGKETKKEKKSTGRTASKYDYPLIDGREMTSQEKKKYRMEQRKKAQGKPEKPKKEEKETKKPKKAKEEAPKKEKKLKKVSKGKKDED